MKKHCIGRTCFGLALVALALLAGVAFAQDANVNQKSQSNLVEGTWLTTLTFSDGSQSQGLLTFGGRSIDQGTLIASFTDSLIPPYPCLPEQGAWQKTKSHSFVASDTGFCYDASNGNDFFGTVEARYQFITSDDGRSFSGQGTVAITSTSGDVVYSDTFSMDGIRQGIPRIDDPWAQPRTSEGHGAANLSGVRPVHRRAANVLSQE